MKFKSVVNVEITYETEVDETEWQHPINRVKAIVNDTLNSIIINPQTPTIHISISEPQISEVPLDILSPLTQEEDIDILDGN
jgi:hypothetical protein